MQNYVKLKEFYMMNKRHKWINEMQHWMCWHFNKQKDEDLEKYKNPYNCLKCTWQVADGKFKKQVVWLLKFTLTEGSWSIRLQSRVFFFLLHWGPADLLQRFIGGTEELEGGTGELKQQLIRERLLLFIIKAGQWRPLVASLFASPEAGASTSLTKL